MEIILKQDIIGLGYKNDIVNVKSGYGRNFLIPTGKAVIASPSAKKQLAEDLKQQAHKLEANEIATGHQTSDWDPTSLSVPANGYADLTLYIPKEDVKLTSDALETIDCLTLVVNLKHRSILWHRAVTLLDYLVLNT